MIFGPMPPGRLPRGWRPWRWRDRGGTAALEFGVLAPLFALLLAATADLGNYVLLETRLVASLSAGANFAILNPNSVSSSTSSSCGGSGTTTCGAALASNLAAIVANDPTAGWAGASITINNGQTASSTGGTVTQGGIPTNADSCYCPTGSAGAWTWGAAIACGSNCTGGGTAGKFVAIVATRAFTPIFPAYVFIPASNITVSAMAQVQ